jgi:hypothetical protein
LNNRSLKLCRAGPGDGSGSCAEGGQSAIFLTNERSFSMSYCYPQAHRRQCRKRRLVSGTGAVEQMQDSEEDGLEIIDRVTK